MHFVFIEENKDKATDNFSTFRFFFVFSLCLKLVKVLHFENMEKQFRAGASECVCLVTVNRVGVLPHGTLDYYVTSYYLAVMQRVKS